MQQSTAKKVPFTGVPNTGLLAMQRLWTQLQVAMDSDDVLRWGRFSDLHAGIRAQNLIQHSYSITMLGIHVLQQMCHYFPSVDFDVVLSALVVHDVGEAVLKRDVSYIHKQASDDVAEWKAFAGLIEDLPGDTRMVLKDAFLLQFCLDEDKHELFDDEARGTLQHLRASSVDEATIFDLVEHMDYLMFMIECYEAGNDYLLYHVLTSTEFDYWTRKRESIRGVSEVLVDDELYQWFQDFMANYESNGGELRSPAELREAE